jgi:hypothetical protein
MFVQFFVRRQFVKNLTLRLKKLLLDTTVVAVDSVTVVDTMAVAVDSAAVEAPAAE